MEYFFVRLPMEQLSQSALLIHRLHFSQNNSCDLLIVHIFFASCQRDFAFNNAPLTG